MNKFVDSLNLSNFIRASQYFTTIKTNSDVYNEVLSVLKNFFNIKIAFLITKNQNNEFEFTHSLDKEFTKNINVINEIKPFLEDVYSFGFLTTENIKIKDLKKTIVFLPISVFNELRSVLCICHDTDKQICENGLNILLAISTIAGTLFEKKETKDTLGKLENQNKMILESAGEGICGINEFGIYTFVNPAASNLLGYTTQELIGKKSHEVWHNKDSEKECLICKSYKNNKVYSTENEVFLKKDGSSFPVEYVSTPIIKNGINNGAVIVFKDIRQRKKAQNEIEDLLDREKQLRELLQTIASVNDLLITSDSIDKLINMSCETLSSYKKYHLIVIFLQDTQELYFYTKDKIALEKIEKIEKKLINSFLKNERLQTIIQSGKNAQFDNISDINNIAFKEIVKNLNVSNINLFPLRRDVKSSSFGTLMVFSANHTVYKFAKEELQMLWELSGNIGFAIDSYRQKDALVELNESVKTIIDATMEGIFVFENDICIDVNNEAVKLFGYASKQEILGKKNLDFVNLQTQEKSDQPYEIELIKKDGTVFDALVRNMDLFLNKQTKNIFTVVDLSELKTKERLLFQQSKMASMGEMIGNIAHQWRQPISTISMWANNMLIDIEIDEVNNDDLITYANNINEQTEYLSKTIDDFRNFFIPNKEKTTFTLKDNVNKAIELLSASFKTHKIEVIKTIEDISITSFENELTQAILNIIKNAKDILITLPKERKRLIFIDIYQKDNMTFIEIKDNAGGIPKDVINKIFEPYITTKNKSLGTGIGLYMTESIITKHLNGKIFVKNINYKYDGKLYTGAKFNIIVPNKKKY